MRGFSEQAMLHNCWHWWWLRKRKSLSGLTVRLWQAAAFAWLICLQALVQMWDYLWCCSISNKLLPAQKAIFLKAILGKPTPVVSILLVSDDATAPFQHLRSLGAEVTKLFVAGKTAVPVSIAPSCHSVYVKARKKD